MTYQLYKPLRNHLRSYSTLQSLAVIRAYIQNLQFDEPFPTDIEVNPVFLRADNANKGVYEWELELLIREVIINCEEVGKYDMRNYTHFASAVNKLKQLENSIGASPAYREIFKENVLQELFRISHRQFHWQQKPNTDDLIRYYKIFGRTDLDAIVESELGMNARQLYTLGLVLTGAYSDKFGIRYPIRIEMEGILTQAQSDEFIRRFSIGITELKEKMERAQSYDQDFAYTMNPLLLTPLVWVILDGVKTLIAPVPTYILKRFTEGIYYEICNAEGFSAAFGSSFQEYVGDVLKATTGNTDVHISPEQNYRVGKNVKHSVDWIMEDATATIFIECKTKRVRYAGKLALSDTASIDEDLKKMADFIVQVYKTLTDALQGSYAHWQPSERPIYPMVVLLEEWYLFGDRVIAIIDRFVKDKLNEENLDLGMVDEYPYSICSVKDLEYTAAVLAKVGIQSYMETKNNDEYRNWSHGSYTNSNYFKEASARPDLFPDTAQALGIND